MEGVCEYCKEQIGQYKFSIFVADEKCTKTIPVGSFCLPECGAGHNEHCSLDSGSDACKMRHRLMEKRYGRSIKSAPPPKLLYANNQETGLKRRQWITQCRSGLCEDDLEIANKEFVGLL